MRGWWSMLLVFVLALVLAVGCDVRPFSDLENDDDNGTAANDDEESDTNQAPTPLAPDIETALNTPGTIQVDPNDPDTDDTHTFEISMPPANGTAEVDADGRVTYTPDTDFTGEDDLEVTVMDDGDPPLSGAVTIDVTVTATTGALAEEVRYASSRAHPAPQSAARIYRPDAALGLGAPAQARRRLRHGALPGVWAGDATTITRSVCRTHACLTARVTLRYDRSQEQSRHHDLWFSRLPRRRGAS